jgi:hypothetical protein
MLNIVTILFSMKDFIEIVNDVERSSSNIEKPDHK